MSGAGGSYRTGQDTGTPCIAAKGTKNAAGSSIYTAALYPFLGTLPALAQALFVFVQISGRGERGKRVEWQITNTLCLAFDKYLHGTSCTEQFSHSFHKQTGNSLTAVLLQSVLHSVYYSMQDLIKAKKKKWCQDRKKCQNVRSVEWYHPK